MDIPFNRPCYLGSENNYILEAFANGWISGDGPFTKRAQSLLEDQIRTDGKVLLSTSCTHALEMAAILLDLEQGDEVIVPSFTFVSTALAFCMHGARIVFADIRPDTLNIDETGLERLITERTRAIVPVHYAGVGCEMDVIMHIADRYGLKVIEDNAHGLYGKYKDRYLGNFGQLATQSFHETKNVTCGEGGALIVNDFSLFERSEILREKGTNRSLFFRGQVDKYSWVDKGSSYVMSDILAAFLYGQLLQATTIQAKRKALWETYHEHLSSWAQQNNVRMPLIPDHCKQAYHMFYLLLPDLETRAAFLEHVRRHGVNAVFHYPPLHRSKMAVQNGFDDNPCPVTDEVSDRLVRLPFFNDISHQEIEHIIATITRFSC